MKFRRMQTLWGVAALMALTPACSNTLEAVAKDLAEELVDDIPTTTAGARVVAENTDGSRVEIYHTIFFANAAANATAPTIQIKNDEEADGLPALDEAAYAVDATRANLFIDPEIVDISYDSPNFLVAAGSVALDAANCPAPSFGDTSAAFCGAFKDVDWTAGWTTWDDDYANCNVGSAIVKTGEITSDETWAAGNTYKLAGAVSVVPGVTLTIEPGVYVVGVSSPVSWLQVQRGATIIAEGTASEPIVFTSENACGGTPQRGDWGGVVVLGSARNNTSVDAELEGNGGVYGGTNDADGTGTVLKYVRIEYAGWELSADNELNGLTLGSIGSGAEISYIHIHEGLDDGIEVFGGTNNYHHLIVSGTADDCFDVDEGFRGTIQFAVCIQASDKGDRALEISSNADDVDALPRTDVQFSNLTVIGNATYQKGAGLVFKEGPAGVVRNAIVQGFISGLDLDDYAVSVEASE